MRRAWVSWAWSLSLIAGPVSAGNAATSTTQQPPSVITHCVGSGPALTLRRHDSRALLDPEDRDGVHAAIVQRYPVLGGGGRAPAYVMLWRKSADEWLYVSLAKNEGAGRPPGTLCFTATIRANDFEFTRELIRKYFAAGARPA
jgi:hypothetical protein